VTDTTEIALDASQPSRRGLSGMNVAELKGLASGLGITGIGRMRKDELVAAIAARQSDRPQGADPSGSPTGSPRDGGPADHAPVGAPAQGPTGDRAGHNGSFEQPSTAIEQTAPEAPRAEASTQDRQSWERQDGGAGQTGERREYRDNRQPADNRQSADNRDYRENRRGWENRQGGDNRSGENRSGENRSGENRSGDNRFGEERQGTDNRQGQFRNHGGRYDDDGDGRQGGRRRNRQRSRDRKRGRTQGGLAGPDLAEQDVQIAEDDVLVPVAGILDVLDSYAFVRTSGYLPGANDVYVPLGTVKRYGLRKGDAVTGAVKALREGEPPTSPGGNRAKFNALVRLDSVNGLAPEQARTRVEFTKLTPLYPQDRLRLETTPNVVTTRIIDLVSPIGKGQRGLVVSPPKAGKTLILQAIANAITTNNPEVHLMVVLVDERPEEVTDMQRTVKGEVIASTFDRPADDHTIVAELAIERAKRLVELGHDVVVLLDGITRLGRAYNLAAPASGRILSGGVDSAALYPPKKFFGAARNIENGGSLTILATALVETGSKMDEVIFEEFKGTGNWELKLSRQLANRRIFPAVDVNASGTRREDILMGSDELKIMWKLRRVLSALDETQGIELLLDRIKKTKSNIEFLVQVQRTSAIKLDDDDD